MAAPPATKAEGVAESSSLPFAQPAVAVRLATSHKVLQSASVSTGAPVPTATPVATAVSASTGAPVSTAASVLLWQTEALL